MQGQRALLCRMGGLLCALHLDCVEETMRPMAVEAIAGAPARANRDVVSAIGTLDADLLLVLQSTRLIPEELWAVLVAGSVVA